MKKQRTILAVIVFMIAMFSGLLSIKAQTVTIADYSLSVSKKDSISLTAKTFFLESNKGIQDSADFNTYKGFFLNIIRYVVLTDPSADSEVFAVYWNHCALLGGKHKIYISHVDTTISPGYDLALLIYNKEQNTWTAGKVKSSIPPNAKEKETNLPFTFEKGLIWDVRSVKVGLDHTHLQSGSLISINRKSDESWFVSNENPWFSLHKD